VSVFTVLSGVCVCVCVCVCVWTTGTRDVYSLMTSEVHIAVCGLPPHVLPTVLTC